MEEIVFFYKFTFSGRGFIILYVYIFKLTPTHSYLKCNFYFPLMSIFVIRCFFGLSVSHNFEKKGGTLQFIGALVTSKGRSVGILEW